MEKKEQAFAQRIIDIAGERNKPVFMSPEVFAEKLKKYTGEDFVFSSEPYNDLVEASRLIDGLFDQYSAAFMDVVRDRKLPSEHINSIENRIKDYKRVIIQDAKEPNTILNLINKVEADESTASKVSVLPLMCGSGKSTAITLKIQEVLKKAYKDIETKKEGNGMLIVTDSIDRLDELWNSDTKNPLLADAVPYIKQHEKDVTILTRDTYADAKQREGKYPVFAITTQRYFNVLTIPGIYQYLGWNGGNRPLILFDEEPYLNEICELTAKSVNDIDTMLRMGMEDERIKPGTKQWCIEQWEQFREKFLKLLWTSEHDNKAFFYYQSPEKTLTDDDESFFEILEHWPGLYTDNIDNLKNLRAFKAFVSNWSIYTNLQSLNEFESKFTVYLDNREKVLLKDEKVIILDGTGDISPMYKEQDYIDLRNGENFVRSLSHLKIYLVDFETSRNDMKQAWKRIPQTVTAYLEDKGYDASNTFIFTYMKFESKFRKFKKRIEHFGNIKGKNEYQEAACIAQVGLNEMQPVYYLVHTLARDNDMRSRLEGLTWEESQNEINKIMDNEDFFTDIKVSQILADIDQNMFRSAIRTAKNRKDIAYFLFYSHEHLPELKKRIEERYCGLLGASLEIVDRETIQKYTPSLAETAEEKMLQWYFDWDGRPIKLADICKQLYITPNTFGKTRRRHDHLNSLFGSAREKALKNGWPNGYYMK